jgi:hypothetical protein
VTPIVLDMKDWEESMKQLPVEPGKSEPQIIQWVGDFESVLRQNKEEIMSAIQIDDPNLQERLEGMVDRMKNMWRVAKDDQKEAWNEFKRQEFGNQGLATKLIDVICSFESKWIPHEHCACPICWEGGLQQRFSSLPDFVNHMKNTHHVGWKHVKDYWCMTFTKALGKLVFRECFDTQGKLITEMGNAFAWCPYPKCKHTQDRGSSFIRHFEKEHKHKTVPAMGIWALIAERIKQDPNINIGQFLNMKSGFVCSKCGFFALSRKSVEDHCGMKHNLSDNVQCIECQNRPAIRAGGGEGDDPTLKMKTDALLKQAEPKSGSWTKEEADETGRLWYRELLVQWQQGVQEKQISREESRRIRKDGCFPIFIQNSIIPMWKAWKGVSFQAIQGLYKMSIYMQRTKMREMRNMDMEMYGPRKKVEGKQLEAKMKASKAARVTHQILEWTDLIGQVLNWLVSDLIARQVEADMNGGSQ